ncbi:MarR family winged helix-turn-helix transcriptional regulator [Luteimonas sp. MJ293]|uniref:MarR family winged helix-turn-helix transcriptional regulator n=1 Tax=Luteimonas sp. MJ146 TaxID=3129240 RepID=UPI0031BB6F75
MARPPEHAVLEHEILELEHFLPYRLSVVSNHISQTIAAVYAERFGISITEWRVLAVLGRYPDLSAGDVAERTAMDKVAVSRAVARLLKTGLIERETHGSDRRRSVLRLSRAGHRVYDQVVPMTLEYERKLLATFSEAERAILDRLLTRLDQASGR